MKPRLYKTAQRGGALIAALAFTAITAMLVAGMATMSLSYYARAHTEADYEAALDLAEGGINYELRKISLNTNGADQSTAIAPGGASCPMGNGTFSVFCSNKDGSVPWTAPNPLYITASGIRNGVTRTVRISAKGYNWDGKYAVYSVDHLSTWKGSAVSVIGDVGTNSYLSFSGSPGISGSVYFDGPNAGWAGNTPSGYNVQRNPQPQTWPTVDEIANKKFPAGTYGSGGLLYLASVNDNATANPPITGNQISGTVTLKGPGNYFVTDINLKGNQHIIFDNTLGPVNIWVGPSGGTGTATFRGGTGAISAVTDPTKINNIYVATQNGITMAGNQTVDAVVYAYNKDAGGAEYGYVSLSGNPTINGQVLANQVDINGNPTINYVQGVNRQSNYAYWGYDNQWIELNGL